MNKRSLALAAALSSIVPSAAFAQGAPPPPTPPPPAAPPPAAPAGEADAHFRRGVDLYKEADYPAALIEFRRAYEIDPRYQALFNIGETYFQLNDYANALKTLEKYLRDGGAQVPPARREEVQKEIEKLRTRVATLDVTTNVPDVEILLDDVSVGKTPLSAPLVVSAGRRRLTATRPGKPPVTQIVEIAGGDVKKLQIAVAEDAPPPGPEPTSGKVPAAPWVITGVLIVGAAVTGGLALSASGDLKAQLNMFPNASDSDINSAHSKTFALALTTDVLIGASVIAGVVATYFTVTANKAAAKTGSISPRVSFTPLAPPPPGRFLRLDAGPQSVRLTGNF